MLPAVCKAGLAQYAKNIEQSASLYESILDDQECDHLLNQPPYLDRIASNFECLGSSINEGDDQEIETVLFDAVESQDIVAEDLWVKVSWLSFYEQDASLRFRFSFGVDHIEDVAADAKRQYYAAQLTDAVFPESKLITQNPVLASTLVKVLGSSAVKFVERIVYFNAPEGGAYLHHDRERGHAGVVYAQLSGSTCWLALSKQQLMTEIVQFVSHCEANDWVTSIDPSARQELIALAASPERLASELETFANLSLINLINQTSEFVQQLCNQGHARILNPGDAILLPQEGEMSCCWHSVFCIGEETGQALSFAIRSD